MFELVQCSIQGIRSGACLNDGRPYFVLSGDIRIHDQLCCKRMEKMLRC